MASESIILPKKTWGLAEHKLRAIYLNPKHGDPKEISTLLFDAGGWHIPLREKRQLKIHHFSQHFERLGIPD
jgi:hypothetical protein